ncbi:hypothetical protein P7D22_22525 [Lichenihabitans sp. Uapishka_5]|uniref:hypothetical protein n=1 Tax=Lichenihabitans sp. Uapishka_5 TaxID=3037302 RepID=UPI0029E7EE63|nr:hypothetical protein [Lichenihabitans sp. Uapishka_5]MDX7953933.1 hypothetical protein [Lichenihabitans sp. Uapishka_5]
MTTRRSLAALLASLPFLGLARRSAEAAEALPSPAGGLPSPTGGPGETMLTIFLRHDETKTVDEINQHLKTTGWFRDFPPEGVTVVSWYVMMGIGQVVTLRFPAEKLRDVNRLIEGEAWGGYRTEFYPTYDYRGLIEQLKKKMG